MNKISIMIIDDNEQDRYLLIRMLKKLDLHTNIFEAENGREALDFLLDYENNLKKYPKDFPPTLIFLDINMPIMDGFEFLKEFESLKEKNNNYISSIFTMFTSSEKGEDKQKAESFDFVKGFLIKGSLSPTVLKETIESCWKNGKNQP